MTSAVKYSRSVWVASNSKVVRLVGNKFSNINLNYKLVSIEYDKGSKKTYDGRNFNLKEFESEELLEKYLNN